MAYPFCPQEPTVIADTGRLLPESAYRLIGANLSTDNADPKILLAHCRLMYGKLCEAEAKLMQANKKLGFYDKTLKSWAPLIKKMRARTGCETVCGVCPDFKQCFSNTEQSGCPKNKGG